MDLCIRSYSSGHIDSTVRDSTTGQLWRFTGFYGHPEVSHRKFSWELLCCLKNFDDLPWICGGDFNEILVNSEKIGGNPKPQGQMEAFKEALDNCGLRDLGFHGARWTWCNKRFGGVPTWV